MAGDVPDSGENTVSDSAILPEKASTEDRAEEIKRCVEQVMKEGRDEGHTGLQDRTRSDA